MEIAIEKELAVSLFLTLRFPRLRTLLQFRHCWRQTVPLRGSIFPGRRPMSFQTTTSSHLASNASVSRMCCSSHVFSFRNPRHFIQSNMNATFSANCSPNVVPSAALATLQKEFERMTKVLTAPTPSAMKIKVSPLAPNASAVRKW